MRREEKEGIDRKIIVQILGSLFPKSPFSHF
jgi:hypothetical protein